MDIIDKLIEKYPLVFRGNETSCYSFLPEGWHDLVDRACAQINEVLEESYKKYPPPEDGIGAFHVEQIKEKMGTLRFYFNFHTKDDKAFQEVCNIVDKVELDSHDVCEVTGKPGDLCIAGYWFKTLSEEVRKLPEYKDYIPWTEDMHP